MIRYVGRKNVRVGYRLCSIALAVVLVLSGLIPPSPACSQTVFNLPAPGAMVTTSPGFTPALVKGLTLHPDNPLQFDFIVDTGDSGLVETQNFASLQIEATKLIKYFLASLTVPEKDLWVNLSPYEKNRIIPDGFGRTEMGRDLLAQDYILKQLTSSLMYPEDELGKKFWERVYEKAQERFGSTADVPLNTFNKVWIVPEDAVVYEKDGSVFVVNSHLKVMLEEDYLNSSPDKGRLGGVWSSPNPPLIPPCQGGDCAPTTDLIREILIPEIEKEVNEGKNFAPLRQVYNSMILAVWYKKNLKESLLGKVYVDQNKVKGVDLEDREMKQKIYDQYLASFRKGVYNYIKEEYDAATQEIIPRKYFSGGIGVVKNVVEIDQAMMAEQKYQDMVTNAGNPTGTIYSVEVETLGLTSDNAALADSGRGKVLTAREAPDAAMTVEEGGDSSYRTQFLLSVTRAIEEGREKKGWSELQLAGELGVSKSAVSEWKRGLGGPSPGKMGDLIRMFGPGFLDVFRVKPEDPEPLAIIKMRYYLGWTQGMLAKKLRVRQKVVSDMENGKLIVSFEMRSKLFRVLDSNVPETMRPASDSAMTAGPENEAGERRRGTGQDAAPSAFAQEIRALRLRAQWSQEDSAVKMGYANHSYLSQIEAGMVAPSDSFIFKFSDAFNLSSKKRDELLKMADEERAISSGSSPGGDAEGDPAGQLAYMIQQSRQRMGLTQFQLETDAGFPGRTGVISRLESGSPSIVSAERLKSIGMRLGWDKNEIQKAIDLQEEARIKNARDKSVARRRILEEGSLPLPKTSRYALNLSKDLGANILSLRTQMKKTQAEFGDLLGVSSVFIRDVEKGKSVLGNNTIRNAAARIGLTRGQMILLQRKSQTARRKILQNIPRDALELGVMIENERESKKINRKILAGQVGMSIAYLGRIEKGLGNLSEPLLHRISDAIGFSKEQKQEALRLRQAVADAALLGAPVGGINLDPALLNMQIKRDGKGIPLPVSRQPMLNMTIEGFVPVIINVTPVNLPALLGLGEKKAQLSLNY